jgi:hypothetical protein
MFVDRKTPDLLEGLNTAQLCKKFGTVQARAAELGEKVTTTLADDIVEVKENIAKDGDWIVQNPGGESYIISGEKFHSRYELTDQDGVYAAKGYCRALPNPFGVDIEIMASWGSPQYGDKFCFIASISDADGNIDDEPYLIGYAEFQETYAPVV